MIVFKGVKQLDLTFVEMVNRNNRAKKYSESVRLRRFWNEWGITGEELGMFAGGLIIFATLYVLMFI